MTKKEVQNISSNTVNCYIIVCILGILLVIYSYDFFSFCINCL